MPANAGAGRQVSHARATPCTAGHPLHARRCRQHAAGRGLPDQALVDARRRTVPGATRRSPTLRIALPVRALGLLRGGLLVAVGVMLGQQRAIPPRTPASATSPHRPPPAVYATRRPLFDRPEDERRQPPPRPTLTDLR